MTSYKMTFITAYLYDVFLEDLTSGFGRISLFICRNHVFLFVQGYLGIINLWSVTETFVKISISPFRFQSNVIFNVLMLEEHSGVSIQTRHTIISGDHVS